MDRAVAFGLVNRALPASELEAFVRSKAQALSALPADAVRTTKRLMKAAQLSTVEVVMQEELSEFTRLLSGPDAREAFEAFIQKRKPQFN